MYGDDMARRRLQQKGDLYRSGGYWMLRWHEDHIKANGEFKRGWSKSVCIGPCEGAGAFTKKEAQRLAWENHLSRLDQNNRTPQSVLTVKEYVDRKFLPGARRIQEARRPGALSLATAIRARRRPG